MDEKDQTIGFRVTAKEREQLDAEAAQASVSLTDYIRRKVLATDEAPAQANLEGLLRHLIYMESRTHIALYAIHEMAGNLSTAALQEVYDHAITESNKYMVALPDRMVRDRARIAAQANSTAPADSIAGAATNGETARSCNNPQHARLFGDGECFICHVPIEARH